MRDRGSAAVELVLLGVPLLAPLLYLAVALTAARQAAAGVTEAARQAGRAYATGAVADAPVRAEDAARRALADRGVPAGGLRIRYAAAGSGCADAGPPPPAGADFAVCVTAVARVPAVPGLLPGGRREITGRFLVRADPYRDHG